uniref:Uncharacterized protein n=1 Tax=Ovis aries TaxID=9940 RepID=A0AC11BKB9_SHEEP
RRAAFLGLSSILYRFLHPSYRAGLRDDWGGSPYARRTLIGSGWGAGLPAWEDGRRCGAGCSSVAEARGWLRSGYLARFMRRQQVLLLYRRILKAIRQVPNDSDRKYLKDWAREEFKRNKSATEEDTIRMMITQGNMQLKELEKTLVLARS